MRSYPRAGESSLNAPGYRNVVFATHLGCHPHHIALAKADRFLLTSPADQFNANNAANETENNFSSPPSAQLSVNLNLLRDARGHWAIINCILCGLLCALAGGEHEGPPSAGSTQKFKNSSAKRDRIIQIWWTVLASINC